MNEADKKIVAARAMLAALVVVQSSGGNSARIGEKYDDVIIARSAWDDVLAAIAQAKAAGIS